MYYGTSCALAWATSCGRNSCWWGSQSDVVLVRTSEDYIIVYVLHCHMKDNDKLGWYSRQLTYVMTGKQCKTIEDLRASSCVVHLPLVYFFVTMSMAKAAQHGCIRRLDKKGGLANSSNLSLLVWLHFIIPSTRDLLSHFYMLCACETHYAHVYTCT